MGRAEEQARIREVLIALGGSPDAVPDMDPRYPKEVSLGSRIDAYTRRRKPAAAPPPIAEKVTLVEPPPDAVPDTDPRYAKEVSLGSRVDAYTRRRKPAAAPTPAPDDVTIVRPPPAPVAPPAETIRKQQPALPAVPRDPAPVVVPSPPVVRRDPAPVAVAVPVRTDHEQPVEARPIRARSFTSPWTPRSGLAVLGVVATAVAVVVFLDRRHHAAGPVANPVVSRAGFSNPRAYARAMTSLSLANGGTKLDGEPVCGTDGTWKRWTCEAKGKPSLGPYAGHWITYRCSPSYTPQPGGRAAALLINCRPLPTSLG